MAVPLETIVVGLGSNLGDARANLSFALLNLQTLDLGLQVKAVSSLYRTAPWQTTGPDFLNAVVVLEGHGDESVPHRLMTALLHMEQQCGRERPFRYAPRTLDLDLILFGQRVIASPDLLLPHPRALERAFVLEPLRELLPDLQWPGLGTAWRDRLMHLPGPPPQRIEDANWPFPPGPCAAA